MADTSPQVLQDEIQKAVMGLICWFPIASRTRQSAAEDIAKVAAGFAAATVERAKEDIRALASSPPPGREEVIMPDIEESVARALCRRNLFRNDGGLLPTNVDIKVDALWPQFKPDARAVFAALAERGMVIVPRRDLLATERDEAERAYTEASADGNAWAAGFWRDRLAEIDAALSARDRPGRESEECR